MRKELRKPFFIGMFNGVVFTFAFLIALVKFDESFHFSEDEKTHNIEKENKVSPDSSMCKKEYNEECTVEKSENENEYHDQAELNEIHGRGYLDYKKSIERDFQVLISMMPDYKKELYEEKALWERYHEAVQDVADCEYYGSSTSMFIVDVLSQGVRLRDESFCKLILHLKGKGVLFSKTIFSSSMITEAYAAFIKAVGENEYIEDSNKYQNALRKEQKCWNDWIYYRYEMSQKLPSDIKRFYDNCTNMVKRFKLLQLKNQNQALGMCGHEVAECVLPEDCSDKVLLEYPGFDIVWAKHCEDTNWYPKFE